MTKIHGPRKSFLLDPKYCAHCGEWIPGANEQVHCEACIKEFERVLNKKAAGK